MKAKFSLPRSLNLAAALLFYATVKLSTLNSAPLQNALQAPESHFVAELGMITQFRSLEKVPAFVIFSHLDSIEKKHLAIAEHTFLTCLQKTGKVSWVNLIQKEGIDLSVFSHPPLLFSLNQIVDSNGTTLPLYRLSLEFETLAKLPTQKLSNSGIFWKRSCYISQNDLKNGLEKNIQLLFDFFSSDYQKANPSQPIPQFYLVEENFAVLERPL